MAKHLYENQQAEAEANDVAFRFMNSSDVVSDMEQEFHTSFSNVSIHTDAEADDRVKEAGRDAIASGNDIFFGKGILESHSPESKGLMAHELTHVMQQSGGANNFGLSESVSYGEEEGGLLSWFRGWRERRKLNNARKKAMKNLTTEEDKLFIGGDMEDPNKQYEDAFRQANEEAYSKSVGSASSVQDTAKALDAGYEDPRLRSDIYEYDLNLRNSAMHSEQQDIFSYFNELDDSNVAYGKYAYGGGNNQMSTNITMDVMDIMKKNALSEQGLKYFETMMKRVDGIGAFQSGNQTGAGNSAIDYVLQKYVTQRQLEYDRSDDNTFAFNSSTEMLKFSLGKVEEASRYVQKEADMGKGAKQNPYMAQIVSKYKELRDAIQEALNKNNNGKKFGKDYNRKNVFTDKNSLFYYYG